MRRLKNLVFSSVGDRNNVNFWLSAPERREFDLAIHYFGEQEPALDADYLISRPGLKFPNFHEFVSAGGLQGYDAVWVVDDDIIMDTDSINQLFRIFSDHGLLMAQPSFDARSRRPWPHTFTDPEFVLRHTNFVENGVVVFSTAIIEQFMRRSGTPERGSAWTSSGPRCLASRATGLRSLMQSAASTRMTATPRSMNACPGDYTWCRARTC